MVKFLRHSEIDFVAYDNCIENSVQGTVYAMSWYLNAVFPDWSLYIIGNYDVVMPVPLKRKFGLKYALQPQFCQQLGIFSKRKVHKNEIEELLSKLPFFYCLNFNNANLSDVKAEAQRPNYELDITANYESLYSGFSQQCRRNIKKANSYSQKSDVVSKTEYLNFLQDNSPSWLNEQQFEILSRLIDNAISKNCAELLCVRDSDGQILATVMFVNWRNRKYYLMPMSSEKGKLWQSMTLLLSEVIKKSASSSLILDFEGSAIEGVAKFYKGFGAVNSPYPMISKNKFLRKCI